MSQSKGFWASLVSPVTLLGKAASTAEIYATDFEQQARLTLAKNQISRADEVSKLLEQHNLEKLKAAQAFLDAVI